ncbi:proton-conducting transporter transmembrane domain-containing protein [Desulfolutivibrio sulfoxidireducens]|uniref:proton-conducting transporter transmembrane domain-containing protein n=1 Tax=Desulfolutivibrio sulfoxidireducens TaxID=2773299 RepID=UPI00159DE7DE|nr:proton-conducting transporter membrane subunit [Desulfolutivibrio sulfoxidireducens]
MTLFLAALFALLASGLAALVLGRGRAANLVGPLGCLVGCALGLFAAVSALFAPAPPALRLPWSVPYGAISLTIDPLSALFLLPAFALGAAAALYGRGYLADLAGKRNLGAHWFFYCLMVLGMALAVCATNAVFFLVSWEIMSLSPFFLICLHHEDDTVRAAGRTYLIAAHLGTAFLMAFFLILGNLAGSMEFSAMARIAPETVGPFVPALFCLALAGFGVKAGVFPLHVWLPEAHPAAPSHVSAFMSGALIKAGLYGILRCLTLLGPLAPWMGQTLIVLGLITGILGLLTGIGQGEIKRFLAFSSIENIGIMILGLGLGVLAASTGHPGAALLAFSGMLLHVINHALLKGLLFFSAGSVLHAVGHGFMERLGGLSKRMPITALAFTLAGMAISGLPPGNAFFGELLIYVGAGLAAMDLPFPTAGYAWAGVAGLAFLGGLSVIGFTRAAGMVFSGEPRTDDAKNAHDPNVSMRAAMVLLALAALGAALASPVLFRALLPAVRPLLAGQSPDMPAPASFTVDPEGLLETAVWIAAGAALLALVLAFLRARLLSGRGVRAHGTWDCGYIKPTARMQYTASSYAEPMTALFRRLVGEKRRVRPPEGLFPASGSAGFASTTPDRIKDGLFVPLFNAVGSACDAVKGFQHGNLNLYILYVLATLVVLLAVSLGFFA